MTTRGTTGRSRRLAAGCAAAALGLVGTALIPAQAHDGHRHGSRELQRAVKAQTIGHHLRILDRIADRRDGTRASGTPGYRASRNYIVRELREVGYRPRVQEFEFPFFEELSPAIVEQLSPTPTTYANPGDVTVMTYSAPGTAEGPAVLVDTTATPEDASTSGCEPEDFTGFPVGSIALLQRGTCTFQLKAENAEAAGAGAVVIFNRGTPGNTETVGGTLGAPTVTIPVVGASFAVGQDLADPEGTIARVTTETVAETRLTWNVIAQTRKGDRRNVVMAGAHLDSVAAGPGINDNGSGSATILEVAKQLKLRDIKIRNKVRFAWWGAEELGLLGAQHYVADLQDNRPRALENIALYLNFDMVGSPNFVRFVYDGDNSAFPVGPGAEEGPEGSGAIEALFHRHFQNRGLASAETPFSGRSDYGPFIAVGIPAGGLFTGAEGLKTAEEAAIFGGIAGVAYDACYHQACDTIANVNMTAVDQMSNAVAHAVATYARSTRSVNGGVGRGNPGKALGTADGRHAHHGHALVR